MLQFSIIRCYESVNWYRLFYFKVLVHFRSRVLHI